MRILTLLFAAAGGALLLAGCATAPKSELDRQTLMEEVEQTIVNFKRADATMERLFRDSWGYAVFPTVGKGGAGLGGAYGRGILFEQGRMIGYCDLSQVTVGFQFGGQAYSEVVFLKGKSDLDRFTSGRLSLAAQASAVAATTGASADADFRDGVLVFTMVRGGLMYEASIGGQKFTYQPFDEPMNQ